MRRKNTLKTIRNVIFTIVVMLLLIVGGGLAYVRYVDNGPVQPATEASAKPPVRNSLPPAHKPNPKNPVGVSVQSLFTPVKAGQNTSITIRTTPTAKCTIKVTYGGVASKDSGLNPKLADEYGMVTWSWTVEKTVPVSKAPVGVTCAYGKMSGFVSTDLAVE